MKNFRNYYDILGVTQEATEAEIKQAFRRLARQYHPDLNPGNKTAEERFKVVGEAYEVLSDLDKRRKYDQFSSYWQQEGFTGSEFPSDWQDDRPGRSDPRDDFRDFPDFDTFVDELLGPRAQRDSPRSTVTMEDFRQNSDRADRFRPGTSKKSYTITPRAKPRDIEAQLALPLERAYTGGRERIRLEDGRTLEVEMPGGLITGQQVRLRDQGINGGDLYLKIEVLPHPFYRLEGADLYCQVPVTPPEAVLGTAIAIPTLDGPVQMTLPPGARDRQRLRLAEKGYPGANGQRGDQIVEIQWVLPRSLTTEEQALYEKLLAIASWNPRAGLAVP